MYPYILMIGPPGSGKDTHANFISKSLPLINIGSGAVIQQAMRDGVLRGEQWAIDYSPRYKNGEYLDDAKTCEIFVPTIDRMIAAAGKEGAFLNGFPRKVAQMRAISQRNILGVVVLDVSDTVAYNRMLRRPGREDNSQLVALKRLRTYHETVPPVIDAYRHLGVPVGSFDAEEDLIGQVSPQVFNYVAKLWHNR